MKKLLLGTAAASLCALAPLTTFAQQSKRHTQHKPTHGFKVQRECNIS